MKFDYSMKYNNLLTYHQEINTFKVGESHNIIFLLQSKLKEIINWFNKT